MSLIILDRDGVINVECLAFVKCPDEWQAIPGSLAAIGRLTEAGHQIAVATNQSGLGRGYYDLATLNAMHDKMLNEVKAHGGKIDAVCFCPHLPDAGCDCRKPLPGLFLQIGQLLQADLSKAIAVGDSIRDLQAASAVGATLIGVRTGNGEALEQAALPGVTMYDNLAAWVDVFLAK